MKPVNLLPRDPRAASGSLSGSAYGVVGLLGVLLLMALVYVVTANQVTSRTDETAKVAQERQAAENRARSLGAFGDFAAVARERTNSVKSLADGRFDWERFTRELAHVLPQRVWLTEVDASVLPEDQGAGAPATAATPAGPTAKLTGCAKSQPDVAKLMVRLRKMNDVDDVKLADSTRGEDEAAGSAPAPAGDTSDGCAQLYTFDVSVIFEPLASAPGAAPKRVPAKLGGGS
jgi:Tfp pilus assembly protein PilN